MSTEIVHSQSPEEEELSRKLDELATLEAELAEQELDLATLTSDLNAFERRYLGLVGIRYAQLDKLEAEIAELRASRDTNDEQAQQAAVDARERAQESASATGGLDESLPQTPFHPTEDLKRLYRQVARAVHPDLAVDEAARAQRTRLMIEANRAYEEGDVVRLEAILREWEKSPESVEGGGIAAELIRVIRKIAQIRERLHHIELTVVRLEASEMWSLKAKVEEAESAGRDLLEEMVGVVDARIAEKKQALVTMKDGVNRE